MTQVPGAAPPDEQHFLKLLQGLSHLPVTGHEVGIVSRIARFAASATVLEHLASVPKWYGQWEIRESLLQNPRTPEAARDTIGTSVAVMDLMRELDARELSARESDEIRQDIRSLLRTLPSIDREVVKARARSLAASRRLAPEPPASPSLSLGDIAARAAEQSELDEIRRARSAESTEFLVEALSSPKERVRQAALENSNLDESLLQLMVRTAEIPEFVVEVANSPRWSYRDSVRRAVIENPRAPAAVRNLFAASQGLLMSLMRYFNEPLEAHARAQLGKGIMAEMQTLPEAERFYLKSKIGDAWKPFLGEVMGYIEEDFKHLKPVPVGQPDTPVRLPAPPAPTPAPPVPRQEAPRAPAPVPLDGERLRGRAPGDPGAPAEPRKALARLPVEERQRIASSTVNREEIGYLLHDPNDLVFEALLRNPAVSDPDIVAIARKASRERVRRIVERPEVYSLPAVKLALLHNPATPEMVALACLDHVSDLGELLHVERDPRVASLDVKAKARSRLLDRYRAMDVGERVAAIKKSGGELLSELWTDAFSDERTLLQLLNERGLDEGIVLRIARARIAPRAVLAAIAREAGYTASYQIRLELVMNPKTPRDIVARLVPRLAPGDRARLKGSRQVADHVRAMAGEAPATSP